VLFASAPPRVGDPLAFYEIAATVIPVLFISTALEARWFEEQWRTLLAGRFILIPVYLVTVVGGETEAFKVLYTRQVPSHASSAVTGALTLLGAVVIAMPLARALTVINRDLWENNRYPLPRYTHAFVILVVIGSVLLTIYA
jgi:hypothetical protein